MHQLFLRFCELYCVCIKPYISYLPCNKQKLLKFIICVSKLHVYLLFFPRVFDSFTIDCVFYGKDFQSRPILSALYNW